MDYREFDSYRKAQRAQKIKSRVIIALAAAFMFVCWFAGGGSLSPQEKRIYGSVVRAQEILWRWKTSEGIAPDEKTDLRRSGLIGVEWSFLSTTLGSLEAKRTACDPRWAVETSRWLDELGAERGDKIVLLSSSSFPGMILNVLAALETRGAEVVMILSLGSSAWGANDPRAPWPVMAAKLREVGLIHTKPRYMTLGGGGENGGGLDEEAVEFMTNLAKSENIPLVVKNSLEEMIAWKTSLIEEIKPKAVINIGGGHSSLGDGDGAVNFAPGPHLRPDKNAGNGVMARALESGFPVIHILNMKELCSKTKIPFDAEPSQMMRGRRSLAASAFGLLMFAAALVLSERWRMK